MLLGYNLSGEYQDTLDIKDIGNFSLHCMNITRKLHWFVIVRTLLGTTTIVEFGPETFETDLIQNGYGYKKFENFRKRFLYIVREGDTTGNTKEVKRRKNMKK